MITMTGYGVMTASEYNVGDGDGEDDDDDDEATMMAMIFTTKR